MARTQVNDLIVRWDGKVPGNVQRILEDSWEMLGYSYVEVSSLACNRLAVLAGEDIILDKDYLKATIYGEKVNERC